MDKDQPEHDYFPVSHLMAGELKFRFMKTRAQTLYFHLCRLRNLKASPTGWMRFTDEELTVETGMSRPTISLAKKECEACGFIQYTTTKNRTKCRYRVVNERKPKDE